MRLSHLIFAAVAIGSMTTAAQASCSSEHVNSTRLNPTELSGYQKCWLKEHKSEEKIGTIGTLFYVQATEEDYVSMPVSSLVKMGEEAGAEFVTDRVMELTIRELNGIVNSDEVVKHQEEIIELDEEHKSIKYSYENKLTQIAKLEDQVNMLLKTNAMHMKSIIDLFEVNEMLNESYSQYYSDSLESARSNTEYWVNRWIEADNENAFTQRKHDTLIDVWGETVEERDLAVSERDLAEDSVAELEAEIATLETDKDQFRDDYNDATKRLKERQTEGYALIKERDELLRQVEEHASELSPDGKANVKGMLEKIEHNENLIKSLQGIRDDLVTEKDQLEFDLKYTEVQRDEAIELKNEYQAMKVEELTRFYERWRDDSELMEDLGHRPHDLEAFQDKTERMFFVAERMEEITENKFEDYRLRDRPLGGLSNNSKWWVLGKYQNNGREIISHDLSDFFLDPDRPELSLEAANVLISFKGSNTHKIQLENLWEVQTLNMMLRDAVSKTVTKGLEHAADMYAQGFKDGYEQGYAVGFVDGYNTAIEDFKRDDL